VSEKVAIVGSRGYPNPRAVGDYVRGLPADAIVVSGACPNSPDEWAERAARARGLKVWSFPVDTIGLPEDGDERRIEFGKRAYARNAKIVAACDRVVAFHDGQSPGTRNTINLARRHGKPVEVIGA
jgi:hypothetical protein